MEIQSAPVNFIYTQNKENNYAMAVNPRAITRMEQSDDKLIINTTDGYQVEYKNVPLDEAMEAINTATTTDKPQKLYTIA